MLRFCALSARVICPRRVRTDVLVRRRRFAGTDQARVGVRRVGIVILHSRAELSCPKLAKDVVVHLRSGETIREAKHLQRILPQDVDPVAMHQARFDAGNKSARFSPRDLAATDREPIDQPLLLLIDHAGMVLPECHRSVTDITLEGAGEWSSRFGWQPDYVVSHSPAAAGEWRSAVDCAGIG